MPLPLLVVMEVGGVGEEEEEAGREDEEVSTTSSRPVLLVKRYCAAPMVPREAEEAPTEEEEGRSMEDVERVPVVVETKAPLSGEEDEDEEALHNKLYVRLNVRINASVTLTYSILGVPTLNTNPLASVQTSPRTSQGSSTGSQNITLGLKNLACSNTPPSPL